jgi:chromate transporter
VTIGLVLGSGWVLTRAADHTPAADALTALTVIWMAATRWSPFWLLAMGATLGLAGLL